MKAQNLAATAALQPMADVALPQLEAFDQFACQFRSLSASVKAGRTQAAFTSQKGAAQSTLPANKWSRGCRALNLPFWHCAWLPSWPLVQRKLKTWFTLTNRLSPKSPSTPANTSKTKGRALLGLTARPALFLSDAAGCDLSATSDRSRRNRFALDRAHPYGGGDINAAHWSSPCGPLPSSLSSPSALLRLAPKKKPRSSLHRLRFPLSRPIPANTSNTLRRGFGPALAAAFVCTSVQEVATC